MPKPGSSAARGYGYQHRKLRTILLAKLRQQPGQPCPLCGRPMYPYQALDLDHTPDRQGYRGLAHAGACNRRDGARRRWARAHPARRASRAW